MTTFAVGVCTDGDYDIDFAVIEITHEVADHYLRYKAVLEGLLADNKNIISLSMIDHLPLWVRYQPETDEGVYHVLGYDENEQPEITDLISNEDCVPIADLDIPEARRADIRYCTLHVTDIGLWWEGQDKYSDHTINTDTIAWSDLEDLVSQG